MFRPNSAIFRLQIQCQRKSVWSKYRCAGGGTRSRLQIWLKWCWHTCVSAWCVHFLSVSSQGWFLRHGGPVSEVVVWRWSLYVGCCGGSTPLLGGRWALGFVAKKC
jgi:hypothetical protein